ncbi:MAG: hypothetical protein U0587_12245 [Candidatus Binatia bacterium]
MMNAELASVIKPINAPRIVDGVYTHDQYQRLLQVVRNKGPWTLILSQHFKSPEEVVATTSGSLPEGFTPTWDMFLSPVFRGYLGQGGVSLYPELDDCYYNHKFLELVRGYWGAPYALPELYLFNIQGPSPSGGSPHLDGTWFRGMDMGDTPVWLLNTMSKSGLFKHWQAKKAQVIAWWYKGRIGGGFHYWPDGPQGRPTLLGAPMWNRGVVVENERMYHTAQGCGPEAMRRPVGLAINSLMGSDPDNTGGWIITTDGKIIQRIPEEEFRFLVHWGAQLFSSYEELKTTLDHSDDITREQAFDMFIADIRRRGETVTVPSDPLTDTSFIQLLTRVYDPGKPRHIPADPTDAERRAA